MNKKVKIIIIAVIVLAVVVVGSVFGVQKYQEYYERTYIVIDEVEYRRDIASLDLSGTKIGEFEKLKELTCLEELNLCDTGITIEQHDALQTALPACSIHWSVPFQGGYCDSETTALDLAILTADDLDVLEYLPQLQSVKAETCRNYGVIMDLMERYPQLEVSYTVEVKGKVYACSEQTLDIANPDADELMEKLAYMPDVTTVNLTGQLPTNEALLEVQQAYPGITFVFDFEIFGIAVNTLDEFIDLSGIKFSSAEEIDAVMPHFYNLAQIDMVNCGIKNADMDALNKRHPNTKIVWKVNVCGVYLRTDALYFMPWQYNCSGATGAQCYNLRYCTDMQVIDLGHYGTNDLSFLEHMPNMKYFLACEAYASDMIPVGNCTSLEYIELQMSKASDLWPLTNLTNLRDLNLSEVPYTDITPLTQMTWLDRLWFAKNGVGSANRELLQESLPNTVIIFQSSGHTTSGFRYTPRYFVQRDILGMEYKCN